MKIVPIMPDDNNACASLPMTKSHPKHQILTEQLVPRPTECTMLQSNSLSGRTRYLSRTSAGYRVKIHAEKTRRTSFTEDASTCTLFHNAKKKPNANKALTRKSREKCDLICDFDKWKPEMAHMLRIASSVCTSDTPSRRESYATRCADLRNQLLRPHRGCTDGSIARGICLCNHLHCSVMLKEK